MDVRSAVEALDHSLISGHVGQQAQLDLGVVRVHQHLAGRGHKHLPQLGAQLGADGDVLEVGLGGGEPPSGGDGVLEAGVDAPVGGDDFAQAVGVGRFQLGELAVVQNGLDNGVLAPQLLQYLGVGGVAGFCLLHRRQAQLVKENFSQLLGGVDVELLPGQLIDEGLVLLDALSQSFAEGSQSLPIHQHAGSLHLGQHRT